MGKFAAIEARATQYPASANDVVWLTHTVRELREALLLFRTTEGWNCFCSPSWEESGVYPNHSPRCELARRALFGLMVSNVP